MRQVIGRFLKHLDARRLNPNLRHPGFVNLSKCIPHGWRDSVEEIPSRATSVQDMTTLRGISFATKVIHYS